MPWSKQPFDGSHGLAEKGNPSHPHKSDKTNLRIPTYPLPQANGSGTHKRMQAPVLSLITKNRVPAATTHPDACGASLRLPSTSRANKGATPKRCVYINIYATSCWTKMASLFIYQSKNPPGFPLKGVANTGKSTSGKTCRRVSGAYASTHQPAL